MSSNYKYKLLNATGSKLIVSLMVTLLIAGTVVLAQTPPAPIDTSYGLKKTGETLGTGFKYSEAPAENLNRVVGGIVQNILALTGVIFMLMIVVAGDLWMTAGGNEEKLKKARDMIFNGVIGLAIVFAAYLAADFLVKMILDLTGVK